jgi:hypothetical protein
MTDSSTGLDSVSIQTDLRPGRSVRMQDEQIAQELALRPAAEYVQIAVAGNHCMTISWTGALSAGVHQLPLSVMQIEAVCIVQTLSCGTRYSSEEPYKVIIYSYRSTSHRRGNITNA